MKLILLKSNLLNALKSVEKAVGNGSRLPVLQSIHCAATKKDSKIVFTATNLEIAIRHTIQGKVLEEGNIIIPFNILYSIINSLVAEKIHIEQRNKTITITADNYEATINIGELEEFPIIPTINNTQVALKIKTEDLLESISQALTATQYSEIRPEINGIFFLYDNQQLTLVGTDSFRLVEKTIDQNKTQSALENGTSFIVPLQTMESVLKIIKDGEVEILIDSNQALFRTENKQLITRLVDGTFPDYKLIIPKENETEIFLERAEFINAVRTVKTFSGRAHDVVLQIEKKVLEVRSAESTLGENTYRIPIRTKGKQQKIEISFNWHYLLDGLRMYKGDEIILGLSGAEKPVMIKNREEQQLIYVVMPIRV